VDVALAVVIFDDQSGDFCLRPERARELARLGVTNAALVRDDHTVGIVLEGWLFDPGSSAESAAFALGATRRVRTLLPVIELAVSAATGQGG
jgi:hypothetical protein